MQCTLSVPLSVARTITFQYLFLHLFPYDRHIARIMRDPIQPSSSLKDRQPPVFLKRCVFFPWCDDLNSGEVEGNLTLIVSTRKHFKEGARKTSRKTGFRECARPTWSSSILHQQELTMFLRFSVIKMFAIQWNQMLRPRLWGASPIENDGWLCRKLDNESASHLWGAVIRHLLSLLAGS